MKKNISSVIISLLFVFLIIPVYGSASTRPAIVAESVLAYTNVERYREGLPFLTSNVLLSQIAREKMYDMFAYEYFAHESLKGVTVSDQAKKIGYEYILVGENLALGDFTSSKHVVDAWMESPGHRKNILSEVYSEIGISAGRGMYEGRNTWIVVQSFGLPRTNCPSVDKELETKIDEFERKLEILKTIAEIRDKEAKRRDGSIEERKARVESYNTVARLYNFYAEGYRKVVEAYNENVGEYNDCVKEVTDKIETD